MPALTSTAVIPQHDAIGFFCARLLAGATASPASTNTGTTVLGVATTRLAIAIALFANLICRSPGLTRPRSRDCACLLARETGRNVGFANHPRIPLDHLES